MSAGKTIICCKYNQSVFRNAHVFYFFHNFSNACVHSSYSCKIANQISPFILSDFICQINTVRMSGQMRNGLKRAVLIKIRIFFRMVVQPWGMRRRIGYMKVKGLFLILLCIEKFQGILRNGICHIALLPIQNAILVHGSSVIGASAGFMTEPVGKSLLNFSGSSHMPLSGQSTAVSVFCQGSGIGILSRQILQGRLFFIIIPQPVMNSMLGRNRSGQKTCPGR